MIDTTNKVILISDDNGDTLKKMQLNFRPDIVRYSVAYDLLYAVDEHSRKVFKK